MEFDFLKCNKVPCIFKQIRDLTSWINGIMALVSSEELAKDVASAEALLDRHQVGNVDGRLLCFDGGFVDSDRYDSDRLSLESKQCNADERETSYLGKGEIARQGYHSIDIKKEVTDRKCYKISGKAKESSARTRTICGDEKERQTILLLRDIPEARMLLESHKVCLRVILNVTAVIEQCY